MGNDRSPNRHETEAIKPRSNVKQTLYSQLREKVCKSLEDSRQKYYQQIKEKEVIQTKNKKHAKNKIGNKEIFEKAMDIGSTSMKGDSKKKKKKDKKSKKKKDKKKKKKELNAFAAMIAAQQSIPNDDDDEKEKEQMKKN